MILRYLSLSFCSVILTVIAYFITPVACLFLDADGNLKYLRGWLQTTDASATGDPVFWPQQHPGYSPYKLSVLWLWRNPSQGFDQKLRANVTMQTPVTIHWHNGDNYLYTCDGYFHLSYRLGLATGGLGWRLNNIVEGYPHKTMGQIVTTVLRFHK